MITLIMDCATVLAAILHATGHATETWGGTVSLWDAKFTNILELINFCFLFVFMLHIVNYKWLSLIMCDSVLPPHCVFFPLYEMSMRLSVDTNQYILGQRLLANMDFSGPITLLRFSEQPTCPSY